MRQRRSAARQGPRRRQAPEPALSRRPRPAAPQLPRRTPWIPPENRS